LKLDMGSNNFGESVINLDDLARETEGHPEEI